jgi:hypothetical protein
MKTTRPAHRGIMPQVPGAAHVRVSGETAVRAPLDVPAAIVVNPSASSQAFAQMAAEEPMMHPPKYEALEAAQKTWRRLAGQNLLPKLIANVKFKDRIEARLKLELPPGPDAVTKFRRCLKVAGE